MAKYHISPRVNAPRPCRAKIRCRFGEVYESRGEALTQWEKANTEVKVPENFKGVRSEITEIAKSGETITFTTKKGDFVFDKETSTLSLLKEENLTHDGISYIGVSENQINNLIFEKDGNGSFTENLVAVMDSEDIKERVLLRPISNSIGEIEKGVEMSFDEANGKRANPKYEEAEKYQMNCQTCVVAFEARRRGFDVESLPKINATQELLSRNTRFAWIDPETGEHPRFINEKPTAFTKTSFKKFLDENVEEGKRYTIEHSWKRSRNSGHIVHVDKVEGELRFYDPQTGKLYKGKDLSAYLDRIKFKTPRYVFTPRLLRVDNLEFNSKVVNKILKKSEKI